MSGCQNKRSIHNKRCAMYRDHVQRLDGLWDKSRRSVKLGLGWVFTENSRPSTCTFSFFYHQLYYFLIVHLNTSEPSALKVRVSPFNFLNSPLWLKLPSIIVLDRPFWWKWPSSLASERKITFDIILRCILDNFWLLSVETLSNCSEIF